MAQVKCRRKFGVELHKTRTNYIWQSLKYQVRDICNYVKSLVMGLKTETKYVENFISSLLWSAMVIFLCFIIIIIISHIPITPTVYDEMFAR